MAKKRSRTSSGVKPTKGDDFKLINGIGPAAESHLHSVSIVTFAQLAALSPADIAAAVADPAMTTERIMKQNWIGQARELAAKSTLAEPEQIDQVHEIMLGATISASQMDAPTTPTAVK